MIGELKACKSLYDLSDILYIPAKVLAYLLYKLPDDQKYKSFCISKKNGGKRFILAPDPRLKSLQRSLSDILYECYEAEVRLNKGTSSFGFRRKIGIWENADQHTGRRWVFNADLKDFFPSINFGRVRGFFISNRAFQLDPKVATIIAQIACFDNMLPQGAPSSPIISNLIGSSLDYRMALFARENRCTYSRYVDDLTFSTNLTEFPASIATRMDDLQGWSIGPELQDKIENAGFFVNHSKSRMSYRSDRQMVTGLVSNKYPNIPSERIRLARSAVNRLLRNKSIKIDPFCETFKNNCEVESDQNNALVVDQFAKLDGQMAYFYQTKDRNDKRDSKKKFFAPSGIARTYRQFLMYKYFIRGAHPILLTEGPSDIIYLKSYLRAKNINLEGLSRTDDSGDGQVLCQFYNFPDLPGKLLGLTGGSGNIKIFIEQYKDFTRLLSKDLIRRPFIILLDNDDGIKDFLSAANTAFGQKITIDSDEEFYVLTKGLALVKTPVIAGKSKSCIEDFFPNSVIKKELNGKKFSPNSNADPDKYFGKNALAKYVYDNKKSINYGDFSKIVERISNAVSELT
tara:strand:- start:1193 stop:2905 length:1713 start_codon:yes stop_codon:yes gene_type:complete